MSASAHHAGAATAPKTTNSVARTKLRHDAPPPDRTFFVIVALPRSCAASKAGASYRETLLARRTSRAAMCDCSRYRGRLQRQSVTPHTICSFPFDGGGRFGGDVVGDAVDAPDLVDDTARYPGEKLVRERGPIGGHEVGGLHRPQGDDILVGPAVAHHADRLDRQKNGERLGGLVIPAGILQFLDKDIVGALEELHEL